jgi:WD40 repeat protein
VNGLAFSSDGKTLASASADRTVRLWNVAEEREPLVCRGHGADVQAVAFGPNNAVVLSGAGHPYEYLAKPGEVKLWDAVTGKEIVRGIGGLPRMVADVTFAPDGKSVFFGSLDTTVKRWDTDPKHEPTLVGAGDGQVCLVRCLAGGGALLSAGLNGEVLRWPLGAGAREPIRMTLPGTLNAAALAADGRHLATANRNGTIYILRLAPPPK